MLIFERSQRVCIRAESVRERGSLREIQKGFFESAQGLIAIIPVLREHPQLGNLVPMKSLLSLRWFPSEGHEVNLYCEAKDKYQIAAVKGDFEVIEEKIVAFNEVVDEIYAYITKFGAE